MESLLDNPMKAVLYLKELTTIVQNQQSLIQTQRQRIDELERKVEDLIGENRQLREPNQFFHHHHPSPGSPTTQPPVHLQQQSAPGKVILPGQTLQPVSFQSQPPQHPAPPPPTLHNPQHLQLVLTSPPSPKTGQPSPAQEDKRSPCCTSLVPQTPSTLGRSLGLARKAENQTVLHQFCCPAPDAVEVDSQSCVPSEVEAPHPEGAVREASAAVHEGGSEETQQEVGSAIFTKTGEGSEGVGFEYKQEQTEQELQGNEEEKDEDVKLDEDKAKLNVEEQEQEQQPHQQEDEEEGGGGCWGAGRRASLHHTASPIRVQRNSTCSHAQSVADYELSLDLKNKQIEMLEHKYGGHLISRRAACKIQTAFRQYQLSKNFEKIRNSLLESRLPRRISLRKVRVQNTEGFSAERALAEGCGLAGLPLARSPSLPATVGGTLTDLEDSFNEQVQSLAKSIDDALSNWSLKTICSLQDGSTYQFSSDSFSSVRTHQGLGEEGDMLNPTALQSHITTQVENHENVSRNTSKLMMAFRDVTVQIDSQNFHMSSSVMESSTSVSLGNFVQLGDAGEDPRDSQFMPKENTVAAEQQQLLANREEPTLVVPETEEVLDGDFPAPPSIVEEIVEEEQPQQEEKPLLVPLVLEKEEVSEEEFTIKSTHDSSTAVAPPQAVSGGISTSPVLEVLESKHSELEATDNSSEQMSSSSTSTSARSASEASSKEALQTMILSLPRYHCENPVSCKSPTLSTDIMRKRLYRIGLNLFNINPDKGLQFLISRGFIPDTPIGVAHFLLQRKGLSRQMIGEFLGNSKKPFNRDVLDCVVDEMDFSGMELDEALRKFQAHIRVQGEAQKVERLIEAFSQRYCMCNPDVVQQFHNPDTIFILAFAIILLNTDMYSPNIKPDRKMMLEDFIRNLRGVDDGADIPRDTVVGIYERIQLRELRSNEDHVTYVTKVEQSIVGMKTVLSVPHRRLVCCSRLFEVADVNKAQKQAAHQREVFLFNDLIVILKLCPKKKSPAAYSFCKAMGLLGMQFHLFENEHYSHGITILSPFSGLDKKQTLNFCAQSAEELLKFVEDLKESIAEVSEMEQIRIEWELEKQQGMKLHSAKSNSSQFEMRDRQGFPSGRRDFDDKSGNGAVEVSIHNRLQKYQFNNPWSLESTSWRAPHGALSNQQGEPLQLQCQSQQLSASTSPAHIHHPVSLHKLQPNTLIHCQQIVKVIILDKSGQVCVEA
ncbi:IQ motif and SEC7 domain-containing protein 3 isoform X2 [Alosa sapidissima]|uniref:IQ motif and SEC7 domain-containing protein 3 isoform X2 n=2 Tax=Alosa TaxID=34772 RepID=UPI001C0804F0|nr:IQ motif and SEC7 domain-containing protein 3 isoform X2 [Alosa sapidissima]